ncbi:hypothetical protein FACS1894132_09990 [Clostridia bacterium]|nr:hypothetical protein FACS1894132_09990 [Clostridia bacterium]
MNPVRKSFNVCIVILVFICWSVTFSAILQPATITADTREIICTTTEEINNAFYTALPGDVIKIAPGEYLGKKGTSRDKGYSGYGNAWFFLNNKRYCRKPDYNNRS